MFNTKPAGEPTQQKINLDGISVCIGMPSSRDIPPLTVRSMFATQRLCNAMQVPLELAIVAGNAVVQWARDEIVDLFLQSNCNRLFCIDSDIVWDENDFMKLVALSSVRDVVCASYPAKIDDGPTTFYVRYDDTKPIEPDEYGLFEIKGAGLGFACINKRVIDSLVEKADKVHDQISNKSMASLHKIGVTKDSHRRGEDMSFFESILNLGYKIHLDPTIELGHVGTKVYRGKMLDAMTVDPSGEMK